MIARAACGCVRHHALQRLEIRDLLPDVLEMLDSEREHFCASMGMAVDQAEQAAQLVQAKAQFPAATHEVPSLHMLRTIDAVAPVLRPGLGMTPIFS